jgi:hypothetical protein
MKQYFHGTGRIDEVRGRTHLGNPAPRVDLRPISSGGLPMLRLGDSNRKLAGGTAVVLLHCNPQAVPGGELLPVFICGLAGHHVAAYG